MDDIGLADEPRVPLAAACSIARRLGARNVVTGSWRSEGSRLTFQARMIDVRRMKQVRTGSATGHVSTLGSLLGELVLDLAGDGARQTVARQEIEALSTTRQEALMGWMQAAAEPESAPALLGSALQAKADFVPAILDLAEVDLDAGKAEDVPKLLAALPPAVPPHQRSRQRLLEGRALLALGDHGGAVAALRDAVKDRPQPDWLMWLAEAQLAASDRERATIAADLHDGAPRPRGPARRSPCARAARPGRRRPRGRRRGKVARLGCPRIHDRSASPRMGSAGCPTNPASARTARGCARTQVHHVRHEAPWPSVLCVGLASGPTEHAASSSTSQERHHAEA